MTPGVISENKAKNKPGIIPKPKQNKIQRVGNKKEINWSCYREVFLWIFKRFKCREKLSDWFWFEIGFNDKNT